MCVFWGVSKFFFSKIGCFQKVPFKTFPHIVGADGDDESHGIESVKNHQPKEFLKKAIIKG